MPTRKKHIVAGCHCWLSCWPVVHPSGLTPSSHPKSPSRRGRWGNRGKYTIQLGSTNYILFVAVQSGYPVDSSLYHTVSYYIMLYLSIFCNLCKYLQHFFAYQLICQISTARFPWMIGQCLICSGPLLVGLVLKRTTNGRTGLNNPHLPKRLVRGIPITEFSMPYHSRYDTTWHTTQINKDGY